MPDVIRTDPTSLRNARAVAQTAQGAYRRASVCVVAHDEPGRVRVHNVVTDATYSIDIDDVLL